MTFVHHIGWYDWYQGNWSVALISSCTLHVLKNGAITSRSILLLLKLPIKESGVPYFGAKNKK